ncbi:3-oxoacyl-reductase [Patellaria atrata CBS 101060]|uniref:3-oxoacyl-reductase n=1 Tax=Patellaria atrata CBS 101060 TaxID=1346257 RepID=A0A9P4VTM1_9PEZI|nr:3-oxoacyl-reductase [Patellaria atrata CBS 101060]
MTDSIKGKVIALTGGASGIGFSTAKLLASRGAKLSLADNRKESLDEAVKAIQTEFSAEVIGCVVEVRSTEDVDRWIKSTIDKFGRLDGCANLAGVVGKLIGVCPLTDLPEDEWELIIGVNLTGLMHCMRAQLKVIEDGGSVVNAASIAGLIGRPNSAAYSASKHGVIGLTKSAAKEVGKRNVRVNCVSPGVIETPMNAGAQATANAAGSGSKRDTWIKSVALARQGQPQEVAHLIIFLLSNESNFITGQSCSIDGGWNC